MDMVSASCTVNKGDLPIKITWTRNNQSIYSNDGVSISRTNQRISILSIESVRDRHSGEFTCFAENSAGSVNYTTSLWVNGTHLKFEEKKYILSRRCWNCSRIFLFAFFFISHLC